jgi:hypothetical protein
MNGKEGSIPGFCGFAWVFFLRGGKFWGGRYLRFKLWGLIVLIEEIVG